MKEQILSEADPFIIRNTDLRMAHDHPFRLEGGAMVYCVGGSARIYVNTNEYSLSHDAQALIMPESIVMLRDVSDDFEVIFMYFTGRLFEEAHRQFEPSFFHHIDANPVYYHSPGTANVTRQLLAVMQSVYADTKNRFRQAILTNHLRNILLNIYDKIQRNMVEDTPGKYRRKEELFHKFIELIMANCLKHREVEFYADKLCISKRYLAAITHEVAGRTPKAVIDRHTIQEIELILAFSDMTLQQIADYLNFPDQSYLGRYFKRHTGQSLVSYRTHTGAF